MFWTFVIRFKRWRYVRAMLKSIEYAREKTMHANRMSKTDGLRVIKRFEKVNGIAFDPFNPMHNNIIYGCANDESFFRAIRLMRTKNV